MKKKLLHPSFEFIFAIGIIAILILPPMVMAQSHKDINVMINNGDTVINGKNIKSLSAAERADALKDIEQLNVHTDGKGTRTMVIHRKGTGDKDEEMIVEGMPMAHNFRFKADSNRKDAYVYTFNENGEMHPRFKINGSEITPSGTPDFEFKRMGNLFRSRPNSQSFSYSNTNNDGISTSINFSVSDVGKDNLKRMTGAEKADLLINDLNLTPSFSTGKTNLSFTLTEKGSAEVQFKNSEGKILWSDKAGNTFYKSFELPQNGIYYLQVKQNGKLSLRRIVKEQ